MPSGSNTRFSVSLHGKAALAAITALLCATPAPAQTVTVNYGCYTLRSACREFVTEQDPERRFACRDWELRFHDFVSCLDAQLAANPLCHGIYFTQPGDQNLPEQYWTLWLYPSPGEDLQSWVLFKSGMKNDFRGEGRPKEIASEVCAVVAGRGGLIKE